MTAVQASAPGATLALPWTFNDGGRENAGRAPNAGDCVTRAISIAAGLDYRTVYDAVDAHLVELHHRTGDRRRYPRDGVPKPITRRVIKELTGWSWTPTMHIGTGTTVHLRRGELPAGRLIVSVSKHLCAVVDGTINDPFDPSRDGTRCVYGYWADADI